MNKKRQSEEDYLEKILMLQESKGKVRSIDIANLMGYSKPSISIAMKKLESKRLIQFNKDNNYISLTPEGEEIARSTYKRHKLLTRFFEKIGVPDDVAEEDACEIEHDLSEVTFEKIEEYLKSINITID
ncbi:MAG: metal-dependent transcriptional regulator [Bacilli bacterium]|nr:metal-dependent transcriptional regulator [Bacilli bacterium]